MTREEIRIRVGSQETNRTITVDVPEGDLRPWDLDTEHRVVGGDTSRIDAIAKVTGRARYAYDQAPQGLLHAAMLRSPHPRATVAAVDTSRAEGMPGVRAAVATKGPGTPFAKVRFAGDDVAAVAADTLDQALDALEAITVRYDVERHRTDYLETEGAPRIRNGAVQDDWPAHDEIDAALAGAAHRHEATYRCEVQMHSSLEPHGVVAWWKDDGELEVWASTQATFGVRDALARTFEIPASKVRVHAEFIGGGFGSKFSPGAEGVAAVRLARATGRPVKLMLSRKEEQTAAGNRPSATMQVRAATDAEGRITAWDWRSWGGSGYTGSGGSTKFPGHYLEDAAVRNRQRDLPTDTDPARAMRAPGWPQGFYAAETFLDELAAKCGQDPLEFRLRNDAEELRAEEWKLGAERFGWRRRRNPEPGRPRPGSDPRLLRGAGLASARWGQMGGTGNRVTCRVHRDGTVEIRNGAQDIGTGMKTVMAMLTAEELGLPPESIVVVMGDTNDPRGPASGGSTTTPSLAPTIRHAAASAKRELAARVAEHLGVPAGRVVLREGRVGESEGRTMPFAEACKLLDSGGIEATSTRFPNYAGFKDSVCGCQFAEVEVDTETGQVKVLRMLAVQDCGLVIAEKLAESQVLGGMIQGLSYALYEQRVIDHFFGRTVNPEFVWYKIAGAADMPEMEAIMLSVANGKNNVGAAGLGEPPKVATAGAISNAIANAIGVPIRSLPITPDRVLAALAARSEGGPR